MVLRLVTAATASAVMVPAPSAMAAHEEAGEEHGRDDKQCSRDDGNPGRYLIEPVLPLFDHHRRGCRRQRCDWSSGGFVAPLRRFGHNSIFESTRLRTIGAAYESAVNAYLV